MWRDVASALLSPCGQPVPPQGPSRVCLWGMGPKGLALGQSVSFNNLVSVPPPKKCPAIFLSGGTPTFSVSTLIPGP